MNVSLEQIAGAALSSLETVRASYTVAWMAIDHNIPGDFVECGVFAGAQCAAMAMAMANYDSEWECFEAETRRVHLFDSFSGIPQAGPHDTEYLAAGHKPGLSACSLDQLKAYMREWGIDAKPLVYHEGPFEETIPCWSRKKQQIAVLRLDGDLYESTKVCLDHLLPLVSPGGWVIVDDFALSGARKAVLESPLAGYPAYFQVQR